MQRMCAWCDTSLPGGTGDGPITHGICRPCEDKVLSKLDSERKTSFLQALPGAVVLIDDEVRFDTVNAEALSAIRRGLSDIVHQRPGDVFECVNAKEAGGCGSARACSTCALRGTITDTLETGRPHSGVQATLTVGDGRSKRKLDLSITTEKVGSSVLLRLEKGSLGAQRPGSV